MKYTLDWLTDPEVFAVNKIAAHSDHRIPFILGRDRSISVRRLSLKRTTLSAATSDILT